MMHARFFVARVLTMIVGVLAVRPPADAASPFDPAIHGMKAAPVTLDNNGNQKILWNAAASVFRAGDGVGLNCDAGGWPKNSSDPTENFGIHFYVDGKLLTSLSRQENAERLKVATWKASGVGTHTLECRVDSAAPGSNANDSANVAVIVQPFVPGEPGVMYDHIHGAVAPPHPESPTQGERYVLGPKLTIKVAGRVPHGSYMVGWAQGTPYDEQWHIDIVRRGVGKSAAVESAVLKDSGPINATTFGTTLGAAVVQDAGPGSYAARLYFSQKRPDGYFESPSSRVEFEILAGPSRPTEWVSGTPGVMIASPASATVRQARESATAASATQSSDAARSAMTGTLVAAGAASATRLFEPPLADGRRVDICLHWGTDCGQPAADAFCQTNAFSRATTYVVANDIGTQTPTLVVGDGKLCSEAYCDGFASIRCVK